MGEFKRAHILSIIVVTALVSGSAGWTIAKTGQSSEHVIAKVEQVRSEPSKFSGKQVRLAGRLTECYLWECSLCPETMNSENRDPEQCLGLEFRPLINGTGFGSSEQDKVFRFSSVILTAKFDPSCWEGACLDRQVVLKDAVVVSVTERRASAAGLWLGNITRLFELRGNAAGEIKAAARRAGYPENAPIKAFTTGRPKQQSVVCWSTSVFPEHNPGIWPSTLESALHAQSTLDFFRCNEVREIDNDIVVQAGV